MNKAGYHDYPVRNRTLCSRQNAAGSDRLQAGVPVGRWCGEYNTPKKPTQLLEREETNAPAQHSRRGDATRVCPSASRCCRPAKEPERATHWSLDARLDGGYREGWHETAGIWPRSERRLDP